MTTINAATEKGYPTPEYKALVKAMAKDDEDVRVIANLLIERMAIPLKEWQRMELRSVLIQKMYWEWGVADFRTIQAALA